jgi:hypothetical protein
MHQISSGNTLPFLAEATEAATQVVTLETELFLLNQELKTLRQVKRTIWTGMGLLLFTLLIAFTLYWVQVGLYDRGWSAFTLAFTSLIFFGLLASLASWAATRKN